MMKKIVIFAGNECRQDKEKYYFSLSYKTGELLAKAEFIVVTGGGPGLMNEVSKGAYEARGKTIGICLRREGRKQSKYLSKKYVYDRLRPRQNKLLSFGDGFIALPGGIGTLYEIIEIMALKRKGEIALSKPLILVGKYYQAFIEELKRMKAEGFITQDLDSLFRYAEFPEKAIEILEREF